MVNKLCKEHIYKWSISEFIFYLVPIYLFGWFSVLFIILFIQIQFNINILNKYPIYIIFVLPIIFIIFSLFRNRVINFFIKRANKNKKYNILYNASNTLLVFLFFLAILNLYFVYLYNTYKIITLSILLLTAIITLIYLSIYFMFNNILNKRGLYFIEFFELKKNFKDYFKRQFWLKKMCKNIFNILKMGNIIVSSDYLVYNFNMLLKTDTDIEAEILEIEKWFLSESKDDTLLIYIQKLMPDIKISQHKELTWTEKINLIPLSYIKYGVGLLIFLIIVSQNPSLIIELFNKLI